MSKKATIQVCPICQSTYSVAKGVTRPTCGRPACVREARARGLPFMARMEAPKKAKGQGIAQE